MPERSMRLKLGGFVAATLVVLAGLIVLFGGAPTFFSTKTKYTVIFPEAPGVAQGTPIRKSGVRIGEVTGLDLDPETGKVRVCVDVEKKYPPRHSEDAIITRGLLSGDTTIDFLPRLREDGQPVSAEAVYEPDSDIVGLAPVTARSILSQAQGIIPSTQQSLDRIVATFEKLERLAPKIDKTLDEIAGAARAGREFIPELQKTNQRIQSLVGPTETPALDPTFVSAVPVIPGSAAPPGLVPNRVDPNNLKTLVAEARQVLRTVAPALDDIRGTLRRVEPELIATAKSARTTLDTGKIVFDALADVLSADNRKQFAELTRNLVSLSGNLVKLTVALGSLFDEAERTVKSVNARVSQSEAILNDLRSLTKPLADRADKIVGNLDLSLDSVAKGMLELRGLTQGIGRADGSVGKFFSDPMLYNNLNDAAVSLSRMLIRAERAAKDLEVFADKIARKPESIGVGGALRPNSGLKDAPTAPLPSYRPDWPPSPRPVDPVPTRGATLLPPVQAP